MSEESKSFEKKIDRDFLLYLDLTKCLFENITNVNHKNSCELWLNYLLGKTIGSMSEKCDRNIFLSRLLLQMQTGELKGIFLETPPTGPLPCAFSTFGLPAEVDGLKGFEELGFQIESGPGGGSGDFFEATRDGRMFLATKRIPEGMMAYMAITSNEGEDVWLPQVCPFVKPEQVKSPESAISPSVSPGLSTPGSPDMSPGKFVKQLAKNAGIPIAQQRKSPEEREMALEWFDKLINDATKWIQGEDPHNMELEQLFEYTFQEYKKDCKKRDLLRNPRTVRTVLMRDIRDMLNQKRNEVSRRELVLDQYESDQYYEVKFPSVPLDENWLQCARKPLKESIKNSLQAMYPKEVIERFAALLYQERLNIIERGEIEAEKKIAELRQASVEEIKKELQELKKAQNEYKEYYCIYKEVEKKAMEYEAEFKEKCGKSEELKEQMNIDRIKNEIENEIQNSKQKLEKERQNQKELGEKLAELKESYKKVEERLQCQNLKIECDMNEAQLEREGLETYVKGMKGKLQEIKVMIYCKKNNITADMLRRGGAQAALQRSTPQGAQQGTPQAAQQSVQQALQQQAVLAAQQAQLVGQQALQQQAVLAAQQAQLAGQQALQQQAVIAAQQAQLAAQQALRQQARLAAQQVQLAGQQATQQTQLDSHQALRQQAQLAAQQAMLAGQQAAREAALRAAQQGGQCPSGVSPMPGPSHR